MWSRIKKFFKNSETIFLARAQIFLGTLLEVVSAIEPSLFSGLTGKWFPVFLIGHGLLTEYLRKRRDEKMKNPE
jgi:hypothetical protein